MSLSTTAFAKQEDGPSNTTTQQTTTTSHTTRPSNTTTTSASSTTTSASVSGDDTEVTITDDTTSNGGGGGGGGGPTIINVTNNYICNCVHDPEQQFYPTVGTLNSINTSIDLVDSLASKTAGEEVEVTALWTPSYEELPKLGEAIANTYKYGVLYTGAWDTPAVDDKYDHSHTITNADGSAGNALFWPSWPYAPRFQLSHSNEGKNTVKFGETDDDEKTQAFYGIKYAPSGWVQKTYADSDNVITTTPYIPGITNAVGTKLESRDTAVSETNTTPDGSNGKSEVFSLWTFSQWQLGAEKAPATYETVPTYLTGLDTLSDDARRALNILGYDILLRDEFVTRAYNPNHWIYGYYYDSVLDTYASQVGKKNAQQNPLTTDYIVQCLYRAMGQECVETSLFFYADAKLAVDFSPIAQTLTVSVDKVNESQNRVDAFVTRANLDEYWKRAVEEGFVTETGEKTYIISNVQKARNVVTYTDADNNEYTVAADETGAAIQVDTARRYTMTIAEFCVLAQKFMHTYGEEVMTEQEQELLLLTYGTQLPYSSVTSEEFEAIKYMMAKGIVSDQMAWNDRLDVDTLLTLLMRIADKGSRLTFKEVDIIYDASMLDKGYYPANVLATSIPTVDIVAMTTTSDYSLSDEEWIDFYLMQKDDLEFNKKKVSTRFKLTEPDGSHISYTTSFRVGKTGSGDPVEAQRLIQYLGEVRLKDGCDYSHFKVHRDAIWEKDEDGNYTSEYRPDYMDIESGRLIINTTLFTDAPNYYTVSPYGGIFMDPKRGDVKTGNDDEVSTTEFRVGYNTKHYPASYTAKWEVITINPAEEPILCYDMEKLNEKGGSVYSVIETDMDGYVTKLAVFFSDNHNEDKTHYTFDEAGFDISNVDYARIVGGYAKSLYANPYLAEDTQENILESIGSIIPKYDVMFSMKLAEGSGNKPETAVLESDLYWGETKVFSTNAPTVPIEGCGINFIEFKYLYDNCAYYVVKGSYSDADVRCNVRPGGSLYAGQTFVGYIKNNNSLMIPLDTLIKLMERNDTDDNGNKDVYCNGQYHLLTEDLLLITFDVFPNHSKVTNYMCMNIYIDRKLGLVAVGNTVYKVPVGGDNAELLFEQNSDGSFIVNYRAIIGWESGYELYTNKNGEIELKLNPQENFDLQLEPLLNVYTGHKLYMINPTPTYSGDYINIDTISLSHTNAHSNVVIYSGPEGTYAFIFKTSDALCTNSQVAKFTDKEKLVYSAGNSLLSTLLGFSAGSDTLVAAISLSPTSNRVIDKLPETSTDREAAYGKFYKDDLSHWYYIPPCLEQDYSPSSAFYEERREDVLDDAEDMRVGFYNNKYALPYYTIKGSTHLGFLDISTNIIANTTYGTVPIFAVTKEVADAVGMTAQAISQTPAEVLPRYTISPELVSSHQPDVNTLDMSTIRFIPTGLISTIMYPHPYSKEELLKFGKVTEAWAGNYPLAISTDGSVRYVSHVGGLNTNAEADEYFMIMLSANGQVVQAGLPTITATDNYVELQDKAEASKLGDAEQPTDFDWGRFTFDQLIKGVDSGMTIVLIIVLNIIPRIALFIFLILIALATIANVKPWKEFCHKVGDIYKLLTFGHRNVDNIDASRLLISSIIGMAVFALFMDGTIINVLTWLVEQIGQFLVR